MSSLGTCKIKPVLLSLEHFTKEIIYFCHGFLNPNKMVLANGYSKVVRRLLEGCSKVVRVPSNNHLTIF